MSVSNSRGVVGIDSANRCLVFWQRQGRLRYLRLGGALLRVTRLNDNEQIAYTVRPAGSWWRNMMAKVHGSNGRAWGGVSCLWDPVRGRVALDRYVRACGATEFRAEDLNNNGVILGTARMEDGTYRAVLLEPIAEHWRK
jgi:hypothetical protein